MLLIIYVGGVWFVIDDENFQVFEFSSLWEAVQAEI